MSARIVFPGGERDSTCILFDCGQGEVVCQNAGRPGRDLTTEYLKTAGVRILGMNHCSGGLAEAWIAGDEQLESCHMAVGDCVFRIREDG